MTVVIWGLLFVLPAKAQQAAPPVAQTPQSAPSGAKQVTPAPYVQSSSSAQSHTTSDGDQENLRELMHRVQKLEVEMIQKSGPSIAVYAVVIAAFITALAALGGSIITARTQFRMAAAAAQQARELQRQEALFGHAEKILEFKLKQMQNFYAPMFALLGQSKGLYDKMLYELSEDEPSKYRWAPKPDPEDDRFQVRDKNGDWKAFRLLDQLPAVRSKPKAFALADRILQIGEGMTKIITKNAGLASEDLIDLLGRYMAHYAIISTIHKLGETQAYEPGWHKMGYFPRELDEKVATGYRELSQFLGEYSKASKRMLEALPVDGSQRP
jgi:hypothetical protein